MSIGGSYGEAVLACSAARDFGPRSPDDVYIIYTGGTTGHPKGVMWRHEDIWRTLGGGIDFVTGETLDDEWSQSRTGAEDDGMVRMAPAPLIHGAAMVATLACLFIGDTAVILPKFDPHAVWAAVQRHQVNVLSIIGDAMARPLMEALAAGDYDTSSLISLNSTAALFSPAVKEACAKALPNAYISEAIGSTETGFAGLAFVNADDEHRGGPTVNAGPDVIVIDEAGAVCGPGQTGKLARGGHVPLGYYKDPVKTAEMFTEVNGRRYAVPGDWARVEEDGAITMLGRGNTCVNTGGEKVYPEEVEGALKSHPDVFDALVIGVPDDRLGQRVAALVQLRPGGVADPAALQAHVHGLAGRLQGAAHGLVRGRRRAHRVGQGRLRLGPPVRRRASARHPGPGGEGALIVRAPICDLLGIDHPIVGFTPSEHVAAAISRAGGLGVLGCVRFNDPAELDAVLDWMDANTGGRPYGVDVVDARPGARRGRRP